MRAAIRLFVTKGISATTTRDIASAARIAEGTIYRHFESKDQLAGQAFLEAYYAMATELKATAQLAGTPIARLGRMIRHFYARFDADREIFAFLFIAEHVPQPAIPSRQATPMRLLYDTIVAGQAAGQFRAGDPHLLTQLLFGLILRPAVAVVAGDIKGPLTPCALDVVDAARRLLAPQAVPRKCPRTKP